MKKFKLKKKCLDCNIDITSYHGLCIRCKDCQKEALKKRRVGYMKAYNKSSEWKEYAKKYREKHIEKMRKNSRVRYLTHKEEMDQYSKKWRENNKEYNREYREKHKEKLAAKTRLSCQTLSDQYIINLMVYECRKVFGSIAEVPLKRSDVTPELIKMKRKSLLLKRMLKSKKI